MQDVKEALELHFIPTSLVDMWPVVYQQYDYFKFTDQITDQERYEEFIWVIEQLRKFVGSKHDAVISLQYDLDKLEALVQQWLADIDEKQTKSPQKSVRPRLAYVALRNQWLWQLLAKVRYLMEVDDGTYGTE